MSDSELVSIKDYAKRRGVSVRTVRRWIRLKWVEAERTAGAHGQWRIKVIKPIAKAS